jgi:hypothetical protein
VKPISKIPKTKDSVLIVIAILYGGYATYSGEHLLAIVSLLTVIALFYKQESRRIVQEMMALVRNTKQTKLGELALEIDKKLIDLSQLSRIGWMQILLS